jgi:hypothetical protein
MSPPENANARRLTGRHETQTDPAQGYGKCPHSTTRLEFCPPGFVNFAKVICAKCGAFLRWAPRPSTIVRRKLNALRPEKPSMCEGLSAWERVFIRDVFVFRKPSPRQQKKLDEICSAYLEEEAP